MLARMWNNGSLYIVGRKNGAAAVEKCGASSTVKHRIIAPINSSIYPKELKSGSQTDIHIHP